jgi:glutamine synthetase
MTKSLRIAAVDLNGQMRGKRVAASLAGKEMRMPLSALNLDIFGSDIEGSPLVFESGDQDGIMASANRDLIPLPWVSGDAHLDLRTMQHDDGAPFAGDPRVALANVLESFDTRG